MKLSNKLITQISSHNLFNPFMHPSPIYMFKVNNRNTV